jgi:hypothetical protein
LKGVFGTDAPFESLEAPAPQMARPMSSTLVRILVQGPSVKSEQRRRQVESVKYCMLKLQTMRIYHSYKLGASIISTHQVQCYTVCTLINYCYTVCTLINHCYTVCTLINHCYTVCTLINHCYPSSNHPPGTRRSAGDSVDQNFDTLQDEEPANAPCPGDANLAPTSALHPW